MSLVPSINNLYTNQRLAGSRPKNRQGITNEPAMNYSTAKHKDNPVRIANDVSNGQYIDTNGEASDINRYVRDAIKLAIRKTFVRLLSNQIIKIYLSVSGWNQRIFRNNSFDSANVKDFHFRSHTTKTYTPDHQWC